MSPKIYLWFSLYCEIKSILIGCTALLKISGICSRTDKKSRRNYESYELGVCYSWQKGGKVSCIVFLNRSISVNKADFSEIDASAANFLFNVLQEMSNQMCFLRLHGKEGCSNCACCSRMITLPRLQNVSWLVLKCSLNKHRNIQ